MARYNATDKGNIPFTAEEEAQWDAKEAAYAAEKPLNDWEREMQALDLDMPRWAEDIVDAMDAPSQARIAEVTRDKIAAKKTLRVKRP